MATLTVDPDLFACPRAAYDYLTRRRCLSRTVADLHRRGRTHTSRFFSVLEWQQETQQPHFHVLLDAKHLSHEDVFDAWSRHRPPAPAVREEGRPPLGWVCVKAPLVSGDASEAANGAASYLTKVPAGGFPAWVLAMGRDSRIRRYSTSRGFWDRRTFRRNSAGAPRPVTRRSYAERIADCGSSLNIFQHAEQVDRSTGEATVATRWVAQVVLERSGGRGAAAQIASASQSIAGTRGLEGVLDQIENTSGRPARLLRVCRRMTAPGTP